MKSMVILFLLLIPIAVSAQNPKEFSQEDMEKYLKQMQTCMAGVDQSELDAIGNRSDEVDTEIAALCEQGKRDEAQSMAISYSKELAEKPALQQMKKCRELAAQVMPAGHNPFGEEIDFNSRHVCDEPDER
jgi:hypothetical protein